jgi:two-component system cell cycle response regulator
MATKILSVDDSKTIRLIIARAFKSFDCEVMEAANGVEGLAVAAREKPDVIILDVTMPVMDGTEMLSRLKSSPELKSIPVIMLTAEAGRENVLRIARMGVRDYLVKPFKEEQIQERVNRIVELKARGGTSAKSRKRFDDPINILLVDDKAAIAELIKTGLADTTWKITVQTQPLMVADNMGQTLPDIVFISTSLPDGAGFWLFQKLRANMRTEKLPIFALSVKTAIEDQSRAQQLGFTGIVTKPIDFLELKSKISRVLNLDASYKYYNQREGALVLTVPNVYSPSVMNDISCRLEEKITEAVDAGINKLVIDLGQLRTIDVALIELSLNVMKVASDLALQVGFICTSELTEACKNYEETKEWIFGPSYEDVMNILNSPLVKTG